MQHAAVTPHVFHADSSNIAADLHERVDRFMLPAEFRKVSPEKSWFGVAEHAI